MVELHVTNGDTPTLRLEQNSSSGFAPQTWDVAGNETSFFIRDATSGSTLPFRIRPGAASNALVIDTDNDVGIGTLSPAADLEVSTTETFTFIRLTATGAVNDSADMTYTDGAGMNGEIRYNIVDGDNRSLSSAARFRYEAHLAGWKLPRQQGFLPGRTLLSNLLDITHCSTIGSLTSDTGVCLSDGLRERNYHWLPMAS